MDVKDIQKGLEKIDFIVCVALLHKFFISPSGTH